MSFAREALTQLTALLGSVVHSHLRTQHLHRWFVFLLQLVLSQAFQGQHRVTAQMASTVSKVPQLASAALKLLTVRTV